ncbi:uncharacterized protein LOC104450555 [Eucalyptus grandis]|uniref:uncharacterized protein LOC104450555 n=1 Tax=Eucalyptus grandis TaxID=71139 RepID=UPI000524DC26|nr:uncharacterized protein LOC104450555 [Eucalyptus grandis]
MNYAGNLVLGTAMLVSSVVLLLPLSRKRVPPPAHDILQRNQVEAPRSCLLSSDGRKGERKKKRVKFADDVKEDCSVIPSTEESKKLERSCKTEELEMVGMQSNGVASRIECSC